MKLLVRRLHADARVPARAHPGDAGLDLSSCESVTLKPGERASVGTGIAIALPSGYGALVVPRSGLAARHGVGVVNGPGLIDEGYRGEIRVLLINHDPVEAFVVEPGDRIAQLVLIPVPSIEVTEVADLDETARGDGGFGSSGR